MIAIVEANQVTGWVMGKAMPDMEELTSGTARHRQKQPIPRLRGNVICLTQVHYEEYIMTTECKNCM